METGRVYEFNKAEETKIEKMKRTVKEKAGKAYGFCQDHKEALLVLVPVVVSGSIELIKIAKRSGTVKEEKYLKENYIYDRSLGHYHELRRKPTTSEWRMIDHRKADGELLGDILNDMRLSK